MSNDWWARKLGGAPAHNQPQGTPHAPQTPPPQHQPMAQVPQQYAPPGQVQQPPDMDPNAEVPLSQVLATKNYTEVPNAAQASKHSSGQCPGCGSGNFYTGTSTGGGAHCHDCGYPLVQSGSGTGALASMRSTGPTQGARSPQYTQQLGD